MLAAVGEQIALDRDIRVLPQAELESAVVQLGDEALDIRESFAIPAEIAVRAPFHPPRIDMDDVRRHVMLGQPVDQTLHRRLIAVGTARRHPQAERPVGRHRRAPGQPGVRLQDVCQRLTGEDVGVEARRIERDGVRLTGRDAQIPGDARAAVEQQAVTARAEQKRDVLVRTLAGRTESVLRPADDALAALVEGQELLAQAEQVLIRAQMERDRHLAHRARRPDDAERRHERTPQTIDIGRVVAQHSPAISGGQAHPPGVAFDMQRQRAARRLQMAVFRFDRHRQRLTERGGQDRRRRQLDSERTERHPPDSRADAPKVDLHRLAAGGARLEAERIVLDPPAFDTGIVVIGCIVGSFGHKSYFLRCALSAMHSSRCVTCPASHPNTRARCTTAGSLRPTRPRRCSAHRRTPGHARRSRR